MAVCPRDRFAMTTARSLGVAAAVAATLAAVLTAAPARAQVVKWNLPSAYPADNFHSQNLEAFAHDLAEATGGKLVVTTYPNASLFPAPAIKSAVRIGQAQMGEILISLHDNEDPIFALTLPPFLAPTYSPS